MTVVSIPFFGSLRRVYALTVFYGLLLARLAALPLAGLVIVVVAFDLLVLALEAQQASTLVIFLTTWIGELFAQLMVINFLAIRVFRLVLLEHEDESTLFDRESFSMLPRFSLFQLVILVLTVFLCVMGWLLMMPMRGWFGGWSLLFFLPFAAAAFWLYCRLSFVLPAVSLGTRYGFRDSWVVTKDSVLPIVLVTLFSVLPWFAISWGAAQIDGVALGPSSWVYWAMLPVTSVLYCARTIALAVASAVCFQKRTGWRPGAEGLLT